MTIGIYAMYKGEECLSIGTIYQIAKEFNIHVKSVQYYLTPSYKRKVQRRKHGKFENQRSLVKLED